MENRMVLSFTKKAVPFLFSWKGACSMHHDQRIEEKTGGRANNLPKRYTVLSPKDTSKCKSCPYSSVGFICWSHDGSCLRTDLNQMHSKKGR